jgi:hypothetical protein
MGSARLTSFDISLRPADRAFFFLLLGSTFLLISPRPRLVERMANEHLGSVWHIKLVNS